MSNLQILYGVEILAGLAVILMGTWRAARSLVGWRRIASALAGLRAALARVSGLDESVQIHRLARRLIEEAIIMGRVAKSGVLRELGSAMLMTTVGLFNLVWGMRNL